MDAPKPPTPESEREFLLRLLAEHEKLAHTDRLTPAEIAAVRELLESSKRWKWVASGLKAWALWITALVAASTVGLEVLKTAVKALGK